MFIKSFKRLNGLAVVLTSILILYAGWAATLDFHEDCKHHDDCPLCRYQIDGSASNIEFACQIIGTEIVQTWIAFEVELHFGRTVEFCCNLPNAPPLS